MRPNKKEAKNNFAYFFPISLDIQFDNSNFTNLQESQYLNKSKVVGFFYRGINLRMYTSCLYYIEVKFEKKESE